MLASHSSTARFDRVRKPFSLTAYLDGRGDARPYIGLLFTCGTALQGGVFKVLMGWAGALAAFVTQQNIERHHYAGGDSEKKYQLTILDHPQQDLASVPRC